jgi:hypothetical protein
MLNTKIHCMEKPANFFGIKKHGTYCNYCVLKDISFMSVAQILRYYLHKNNRMRWLNKESGFKT